MKKLLIVVGLVALGAPAVANADLGVRLGLETPIWWHADVGLQTGSYSIADSFQPAINALVEYYPIGLVGIGIEFREGFLATGTVPNCTPAAASTGNCGYTRSGTSLGPNVTLDLSPLPIYVRGALPLHVEPGHVALGGGDVIWNFRAAGGLKIGLPLAALYIEATADFPLAGSNITPFKSEQRFGIGAGLWLKF